MKWFGLALFIFAGFATGAVFVFNSSTPIQLGPVPFFGAAFLCLAGLIIFLSDI